MTFDPLDPDYQIDPYPHFEALRAEPAVWVEPLNAWFVGRYRDVRRMAMDTKTFSNRRFSEISKGEFDYAPGVDQLVATDPPRHTRLRKLAAAAFRPGRVRAMEEALTEITHGYLDPLVERGGTFDFHQDLASRVPIHAITRMLGVPHEDGPTFRRWTADVLSAANRHTMAPAELARLRTSVDEVRAYFTDVVARKRRTPGDDMISDWMQAREGQDALTDDEVLALAILLLVGGDSTTAHLLSNTVATLWEHPEQLEEVRRDRSLIGRLIEESLRYEPPVQTVFWTTTRDVDLDGVTLKAEDAVIGVWSSANRDPEYFPEPDRFDIHRDSGGHQAFGFGPHFCLGAGLARSEARIVLEAVFDRLPNLKPAGGDPVEWVPSFWIRGPRALPVVA
ncbi:cytochrome P450 [Pseudonocardia xishanensis]|uniref:Cytochrome P450 n=1 Tax=Pseudonocardia xishanensis TaxID=630995 RepID=A0ABP8RRQ0_9PSEU